MANLSYALKAGLPLIAVRTDDTANFPTVLKFWAKKSPSPLMMPALGTKNFSVAAGGLYYARFTKELNLEALHKAASEQGATVVLMNPTVADDLMFDVGPVTFPVELLEQFVKNNLPDATLAKQMVAVLKGLSYRDVLIVAKFAMIQDHAFTPSAVIKARRKLFPLHSGLELVDTEQFFYFPDLDLKEWLAVEGQLFLKSKERIFTPRGLLFDGPPGTGKTAGAKYIAEQLKVPLYRLDITGILGKYVGESESSLRAALTQTDALQPCVLLIDEVEKLFSTKPSDDSGVSARVLSWLLWWLQEHSSRVLTILTTNMVGNIPQELYRPGRIDRTVYFGGLSDEATALYVSELVSKLSYIVPLDQTAVINKIKLGTSYSGTVPPAVITETVLTEAKKAYLAQLKESTNE